MKYLIAFLFAVSMVACSKSKPLQEVTPNTKGGSVGPFDLALSGESEEKPNTFSVQINQPDGAVDFFVANGDAAQYLLLKSYTSSVAGCDAGKVEIYPLWYSSEGSETYAIVTPGSTMITTARTRSKLRVVFSGLQGCTTLNFSMVVRKLEVGALQVSVEERLRGTWEYAGAGRDSVTLLISPSRTGWLEYKNGRFTCDTSASPLNSTNAEGGWLVFGSGSLLCNYKFVPGNAGAMDMTCHGRPTYGCTLPNQFRFMK